MQTCQGLKCPRSKDPIYSQRRTQKPTKNVVWPAKGKEGYWNVNIVKTICRVWSLWMRSRGRRGRELKTAARPGVSAGIRDGAGRAGRGAGAVLRGHRQLGWLLSDPQTSSSSVPTGPQPVNSIPAFQLLEKVITRSPWLSAQTQIHVHAAAHTHIRGNQNDDQMRWDDLVYWKLTPTHWDVGIFFSSLASSPSLLEFIKFIKVFYTTISWPRWSVTLTFTTLHCPKRHNLSPKYILPIFQISCPILHRDLIVISPSRGPLMAISIMSDFHSFPGPPPVGILSGVECSLCRVWGEIGHSAGGGVGAGGGPGQGFTPLLGESIGYKKGWC